jgi:2-polyprenyl-6-methoxyphenol hydroxylase-like FAD-dependent oxidoreductase
MRVTIVGGGICGLVLALMLERRGIECQVYEAVPAVAPLGVGISLLPHGTLELTELGLMSAIQEAGVEFKDSCFFNSFGQLIYQDDADTRWPQFLMHRADLHRILLDAVVGRLGTERVSFGHRCVGVRQDARHAVATFENGLEAAGDVLVGCDGINSAVRAELYPAEGAPVFSGINMWRGVTPHETILSGGAHLRAGTLDTGKIVVYPIRNLSAGRQLLNWVVELRDPEAVPAGWNNPGRLEDFAALFAAWRFDWLDVPEMFERSELILSYPMSDRDPVPRWSFGRITLAGDAAHAMVPRGSNGGMQAILDARSLADALAVEREPVDALRRYEDERIEPANAVVLRNRSAPPDRLIQLVVDRTGNRPFDRLEDVISVDELREVLDSYKRVSGYNEGRLSVGQPRTG